LAAICAKNDSILELVYTRFFWPLTTISINGRFLSQPITGVQRYSHELIRSLDLLLAYGSLDNEGIAFELVTPGSVKIAASLRCIPLKRVGRFSGHLWEQFELPAYCQKKLLFTPSGGAPVIHDRHVMTIFDAAVFAAAKGYSRRYAAWYRWLLRKMSKKAERILTISEFSKKEIQKWCEVDPEKITVTHLGHEHILRVTPDVSILTKHGLDTEPFVLAVSSMNPNKNFRGIAEAIQLLKTYKIKFAIAGGMNSDVFDKSAPLPNNVVQLGYVTDAALRALYEKASCFLFPSFYEGFGLPPLEAMACGCPVIVSRAASLPEVCGDAASYCDPHDPADTASKLNEIAEDADYRQRLIELGRKRVQLFSWERTALETRNVLTLLG
jgi:glycosyltransferase involved in cell wall biosynthesis